MSHLISLPSLHGWEGSSVPGFVPPDDMVYSKSVVGVKPGDSRAVIVYQVDGFADTWSKEQFATHSHIYAGLIGRMSSLNHFPGPSTCRL